MDNQPKPDNEKNPRFLSGSKKEPSSSSNEELKIRIENPTIRVEGSPILVKDQRSKEKGEKSGRKEFYRNIIVAIITIVLTTVTNFFLWKTQFMSSKQEKILDYKLAAVHDYAEKGAMKVTAYAELLAYRFQVMKAELQYMGIHRVDSIPERVIDVPLDVFDRIQDSVMLVMEKRYPERVEVYKKISDYNIAYYASVSYLYSFLTDTTSKELLKAFNEDHSEKIEYLVHLFTSTVRKNNISRVEDINPFVIANECIQLSLDEHSLTVGILFQKIKDE